MNLKRSLYRFVFLSVCALLSFRILVLFLSQGINNYERARYLEMVEGTAYRPYVTRALLPATVQVLTACLPSAWKHTLEDCCSQQPGIRKVFEKLGWEMHGAVEYALGVAVMYLSLLGSLWGICWLARGIYQPAPCLLDGAILLELLTLLPLAGAGHIYDYPALCLFTFGLGALVRERWGLYLAIFTLGCLNKETMILLTLVSVLYLHGKVSFPRSRLIEILLAQCLLFLLVRGGLAFFFRNNPGTTMEFHLLDNLIRWREPVAGSSVMAFVGGVLLLAYHWKDKPVFLRWATWMLVPLVVLTQVYGVVGEWRVFYEFVPIGVLLAVHSLGEILEVELHLIESQAGAGKQE